LPRLLTVDNDVLVTLPLVTEDTSGMDDDRGMYL